MLEQLAPIVLVLVVLVMMVAVLMTCFSDEFSSPKLQNCPDANGGGGGGCDDGGGCNDAVGAI